MTDFEINKYLDNYVSNKTISNLNHPELEELFREAREKKIKKGLIGFNYNNPSDMWPIIKQERIMLNPYCADNLWKAEKPCGKDGIVTIYAKCYDINPLRAAALVAIKVLEARE